MWSYVSPWKRGQMDIPGFIHECKRLEVDGVELLDYFWKDRDAETPLVKAALKDTGLPVGVYSVSNNFVKPDQSERLAQLNVIKKGVDSANEFGAGIVRVFGGDVNSSGVSFDDALGWIVDGLGAAAEYAQANGVVLALENHGKLAGKSNQVRLILGKVNSPALRANPDTGNFLLVHQASHEAVDELVDLAAMVHFKDFRLVPDDYEGFAYTSIEGLKFAGMAVGEGDVDLPDCVVSLKKAAFNGWLNIEYEGEEIPQHAVARSVVYTRGLLANSAE
jgi:sugar phosphate isomerase/epimerase